MKIQLITLNTIIALFIFSGCLKSIYVPNTINSPILKNKKDYNVHLGLVTEGPEFTMDFQGVYAFSNHGAILANTSFMNGGDARQNLVEVGGGAFTSFFKNEKGKKLGSAGIYGGYGFSKLRNENNSSNQNIIGSYQRIFVAPTIGFSDQKIDVSFSARISNVYFSDYRAYSNMAIVENTNFGFISIEPTFTIAIGHSSSKFYFQIGNIFPFKGDNYFEKAIDRTRRNKLNIGIRAAIPQKEEKNSQPEIYFHSIEEWKKEDSLLTNKKIELAPLEISIQEKEITICFHSASNDMHSDELKVSLNSTIESKIISLSETPRCFDVTLRENKRNRLHILKTTENYFSKNTVIISIKSKKEIRQYYLVPEKSKGETIWINHSSF